MPDKILPPAPLREVRDSLERFVHESAAALQGTETIVVDIYETDNAIVVKANLVGIKAEGIDLSITNNRLTIKGTTQLDVEIEGKSYLRRERRFGKFSRTFHLPGEIDADAITAGYKGGVLTVNIPKTESARAQKVEIKSE